MVFFVTLWRAEKEKTAQILILSGFDFG